MWFSNLQIYRFSKPFTLNAEEIAAHLAKKPFRACGSLEMFTYGWTSPLGRFSDELIHATNGHVLLCAKKEEKILPGSVIRDAVAQKAQTIEEQQGRPVRRKERNELKEEVLQDMLPKAFTRTNLTFAYIAPKQNLLVVNTSSAKKAEELLSFLRTTLGSLPVIPPSLRQSPINTMTRWLSGEEALPDDFILETECELREPGEDGGIVRCKRQDLATDEVQGHLTAGKKVTKLSLAWQESLTCVLNDDLSIKRLRFSDELLEHSKDIDPEDVIARFDNDFNIMALELARFIPRMLEVLGGENEDAYQSDDEQAAA